MDALFAVPEADLFQIMRRPFHYSDSILIDLETNSRHLTKTTFSVIATDGAFSD